MHLATFVAALVFAFVWADPSSGTCGIIQDEIDRTKPLVDGLGYQQDSSDPAIQIHDLDVLAEARIEPTLEGVLWYLDPLSQMSDEEAALVEAETARLIGQLSSASFAVREQATQTLIASQYLSPRLVAEALESPDPETRTRIEGIIDVRRPTPRVYAAICRLVKRERWTGLAGLILPLLEGVETEADIMAVVDGLVETAGVEDEPLLMEALSSDDWRLRVAGFEGLARLWGDSYSARIGPMVEERSDVVQRVAAQAGIATKLRHSLNYFTAGEAARRGTIMGFEEFECAGQDQPIPEWLVSYLRRPISFSGNCDLQGADMQALSGLVTLQQINLSYCVGITDEDLQFIADLTALETLYLDHTRLSGEGLHHLTRLDRLNTLWLGDCQIGSAHLVHLVALQALQSLWLDGTEISDDHLDLIATLPHLEIIRLDDTDVSDAGLARLASSQSLKTITLSRTDISGAILETLAGMESLTYLDLKSTGIDVEAVQRYQESRPNVRVIR